MRHLEPTGRAAGGGRVSEAWGLDFTASVGTRNKALGSTEPGIGNETHQSYILSKNVEEDKKLTTTTNTLCSDRSTRSSWGGAIKGGTQGCSENLSP